MRLLERFAEIPYWRVSAFYWAYYGMMGILVLFLICVLNQAAHGPQYAFFTLCVTEQGYSELAVGMFWVVGVLAEVAMFMCAPRLMKTTSWQPLLMLALTLGNLRWSVMASLADYWIMLLFAQLLQAFSFGLYHAIMVAAVYRRFGNGHEGLGQALYSSAGFGLGATIGTLYGGYVWDYAGPSAVFAVSAAISAACLLVTAIFFRQSRAEPEFG